MISRMNMGLAVLLALAAAGWSAFGRPDGPAVEPSHPARTGPASVVAGTCPDRFLGGAAPRLVPSARDRRTLLCSDAYASLSSSLSRTPLWAAERLTPDTMRIARTTERASDFEADDRLPREARSELGDYRRSGWDRGHLAPSADMPGPVAQEQSFLLSNIAPQNAELNRGEWADLEADVRSLARRRDAVYVVTGVIFEGANLETVPTGRVTVPTSFWKAVASPGEGSIVHVAANRPGRTRAMSVSDFVAAYGIDPFPAMTVEDRKNRLELGR